MSYQQSPSDPTSFPAEPGYAESSKALTALVLGIIGLVFMPLLAPFAWVMGHREIEAIRGGRRSPANESLARVAKILGVIGTVLMALGLILAVLVISASLFGL